MKSQLSSPRKSHTSQDRGRETRSGARGMTCSRTTACLACHSSILRSHPSARGGATDGEQHHSDGTLLGKQLMKEMAEVKFVNYCGVTTLS